MQPAGSDRADTEATTAIPVQRATSAGPEDDATRAIPIAQSPSGDTEVATERVNARGEGTPAGAEENRRQSVSAQDLLRREGRL